MNTSLRARILMPVFNEAAALGPLLDHLLCQGHPIMVVDDGSRDGSVALAQSKGCRVLALERNHGKGYALRQGIHHLLAVVDWDVLVFMDSDGQHDPAEIPLFLKTHEEQGADIVLGNRMQARGNMPWLRWGTNRFTSHCVSRMAGQSIPDSQCGYRSVRRRVLEGLTLSCERYDLESEMLMQAGRRGFKIVSVPVRSIYTPGGTSHIRPLADTVRFFKLLLKYSFSRSSHFRGVAQLG